MTMESTMRAKQTRTNRQAAGQDWSICRYANLAVAAVCSLVGGVSGITTSDEYVAPFNEYLSPTGAVSCYSGDASFAVELLTLSGRGGVSLPVELTYSSNVYQSVRVRNDIAPTSWVGLGFRMSFGAVICIPNGTAGREDDVYYWYSPEGVRARIVTKDGQLYLDRLPFAGVECNTDAEDEIVGWTIRLENGRTYRYGDQGSARRNATQYSLRSGNIVGEGFISIPDLYPLQWNLAEVDDYYGDNIKIDYEQVLEPLKSGSWSTGDVKYTKASYLKTITNSIGEGGTCQYQ
jgi:hypothetical protein